MLLYNYLKLKNNKGSFLLILLFFFSLFARIPIIIILGDTTLENEWGAMLYNLINHNTLSQQRFGEFLLPNLWLPPLYAYYLYLLSFLNFENQSFVLIVFVGIFTSFFQSRYLRMGLITSQYIRNFKLIYFPKSWIAFIHIPSQSSI